MTDTGVTRARRTAIAVTALLPASLAFTVAAGKVILPTELVALTPVEPTASFTEGAGCGTVDEPT